LETIVSLSIAERNLANDGLPCFLFLRPLCISTALWALANGPRVSRAAEGGVGSTRRLGRFSHLFDMQLPSS
jgi:hypothetical protein